MSKLAKYLALLVTLAVPTSLFASIGVIPTVSIEQSSVKGIDTTQIQVKKQKQFNEQNKDNWKPI